MKIDRSIDRILIIDFFFLYVRKISVLNKYRYIEFKISISIIFLDILHLPIVNWIDVSIFIDNRKFDYFQNIKLSILTIFVTLSYTKFFNCKFDHYRSIYRYNFSHISHLPIVNWIDVSIIASSIISKIIDINDIRNSFIFKTFQS